MFITALSYLPAAAVEMQPGLWELTAKIDRDGAVSTHSPRSRCVSAESARAARTRTTFDLGGGAKAMLGARFGEGACRLTDTRNTRNLVSWRLQCTGSPRVEQDGAARFDNPRHYRLMIRTRMTAGDKTVTSIVTAEGQQKGECPQ
jgi:hypothetical protein